MTKNRTLSFLIIAACYTGAALLGIMVFNNLNYSPWLSLLIADLAATIFVWVASVLLNNASVYDPYWSVQPLIILGASVFRAPGLNIGGFLLLLLVSFWSIRLTINWIITFSGLHKQDWRYDQIKSKSGKLFALVNLIGIQIMPTLIVFTCVLPGWYFLRLGGGYNLFTFLGLMIIFGGTILEMVADHQMHIFKKNCLDRTLLLRTGLWKHSRHPNYLGEILIWWGVYFVMLSVFPNLWYLCIGAISNTCLFLLISIPLAEKHLATYKADFDLYKKSTRMLLPFPRRLQLH